MGSGYRKLARRPRRTARCSTAGRVFAGVHQGSPSDHFRRSSRVGTEAEMSKLRVRNNTDTEPVPEPRPIALLTGRLEQNLDEIEQALLDQRIGIFQRNGDLVMPG